VGTPSADLPEGADNFYTSDRVTVRKVRFRNQYQMTVVGNLFTPKGLDRGTAHPAIVVGHPMGAVKEQSANLYATKMAEQGFVTLSLDLSFWGESDGRPRQAVLPDVYAEAFSAAVDYLGTRRFVDRERIGVIGICGSGSFVISAAKLDPRMRAIATVSMYDMGASTATAWSTPRPSSSARRSSRRPPSSATSSSRAARPCTPAAPSTSSRTTHLTSSGSSTTSTGPRAASSRPPARRRG
jgi:fermentation-respiration switch protein FrsA (DUF1100 family)